MKTRKFLSIFVALSLIIAYMIPFASAAELSDDGTIVWTFADNAPEGVKLTNASGKEKEWYIENTDLGNGLTAYAKGTVNESKQEYSNAFEIDRSTGSDFDYDGETVIGLLKFGGKSSADARYLTYTPSEDGTLTVYVRHGSATKPNTDIRSLTVEQGGNTTTVPTLGTDKPSVKQTIEVSGGAEVKIGCDNNVGLSKLIYTPKSAADATETPQETEQPTDEPKNSDAPAETENPAEPAAMSVWYAKESDGEVMEPDSKENTARIPAGKNLSEGTDFAVSANEDMLYKAVEFKGTDINLNAVETPEGMNGRLTKLLSGGTNPGLKDFGATGASMKVVPSKNGTLYAYAKASAGKAFVINDAEGNAVVNYTNESGASQYIKFEAKVNANTVYYAYTAGGGTDFFGFEFVPETAASTEKPAETSQPTDEPKNTEKPTDEPKGTDEPKNTEAPTNEIPTEAITADYAFISDDVNNGAEIAAGFVTADKKVYSPKGNGYASNKGSSIIGDRTVLNSSKVKGDGQSFAFKLDKQATVTVYSNNDTAKGRYIALGSKIGGYDVSDDGAMTIEAKYVVTKFENVGPGTIYITGIGSDHTGADMFIGGFTVEFTSSATAKPDVTEVPTATPSVTAEPGATATPVPTTKPGGDTNPTATPNVTAAPTSVPTDPDTQKAQADADALKIRGVSQYSIYFDIDLPSKGDNGSEITWTSSNTKYIDIQMVSSVKRNWTGVVSRPMTDEECTDGGVPVTLTATIKNGNASVTKVFDVSVRKFNPVYYNDFQSDVGQAADGDYKGIQDNVKAANGDTFRGIRVVSLNDAKSMFGFKHSDQDVEANFDKRIMSTDKLYGKSAGIDGEVPEENFAFYYEEHKPYGGSTTYMPLWISLADERGSYPEGMVVMSMDICMITPSQKFSLGLGTSKPDKMCRVTLNNASKLNTTLGYEAGGVLRALNGEEDVDFMKTSAGNGYLVPAKKWVTATFVANSSTGLWDLYFDGMQVGTNMKFRNSSDFIATIEFTMDRSYSGGSYLIDNIAVENITDDYADGYWEALELNIPKDENGMYTMNKEYLLPYNGTDGLAGSKYTWKSSNTSALSVDTRSIEVEELSKFGYTDEQIKAYKDKGTNYVTVVVANPGDNIPASGIKVTLTGSMEVDGKAYSKSFDIMVYPESASDETTDEGKARADLNAITSINSGMTISSSKTLDLPSVGSLNGSKITWTSSDSSCINPNTGRVTIQSSSKTVVLTATAENGTAKVTKQFSIYLKGTNSSSGGSGGSSGGGGGSSRPLIVPGTVTNDNEKFGTDAYTPEDTSKMIFNDIEGVSWAKEAIEALYDKNVISGYGNGFFAPERSVTREQFVKMLVGALGLDTNTDSSVSFSDVPEDAWYTPYINAAAALGIVSGKDDGSFGVGESITRQDMAVMCTRALKAVGKTLGEGSSSFNDGDKISDYAKSAVGSMAAAGYLTGDENGSFNPTDTATRAQTAVVLYRIIK